jgi:uncharacterized membrane protein YphA (DoxX/SURF4 family)
LRELANKFLRWAFTALLLASAVAKLLDMPGFIAVVETYRSFPQAALAVAAWALTLTELALGLWLATGKALRRATAALVALHLIYFVWLAIALGRGLDLPNCGCFGVYFARPLTAWTLLEDGILLALALALWRSTQVGNENCVPTH